MLTRRKLWALVALTLMWGVNWPVMKLLLLDLSPLYARALTMSGGALWLYAYFRARGVRMRPTSSEWRSVVLLGIPNVLGWHGLSILGVRELASGRAAVIGFTMPIWTVLLGVVFFSERLTRRVALACVAVLLAIALLLADELGSMTGRPVGVAWMQGAALSWALGTLLMRRMPSTLPVEALAVWMLALSSVALWLIAFVLEPWPTWVFSTTTWLCLAFSVLLNYGLSQIVWFDLAQRLPPATSAMSVMAVPVVGTLSAALLVGEQPGWFDLLALAFVMVAIAAVLLPARPPSPHR